MSGAVFAEVSDISEFVTVCETLRVCLCEEHELPALTRANNQSRIRKLRPDSNLWFTGRHTRADKRDFFRLLPQLWILGKRDCHLLSPRGCCRSGYEQQSLRF